MNSRPPVIRMLFIVGEPGGAERVDVSDLFARRLAASGFDIDYVIFSASAGPFWQPGEWRGARAFITGLSSWQGLAGRIANKLRELLVDLRFFWQALTGPYDIVQVRDKFVVGVAGLAAARLSGKRFVYWMSYPYAECRILDGQEGRAAYPLISIVGGRIAAWLLYRIIMPNSDHVFVQSRQMLEDVAAEGVARDLMTPVPMGVAEELLETPPAEVVPDTVLYLGTLARVRRLEILVEALQILRRSNPAARLLIVGDGPEAADRAHLEAAVDRLAQRDAVEFTGMVSPAVAHEHVARAAVCVSPFYPTPILQSTSPTKISEYLALGRPVVANSHPEQSMILQESGGGICVDWSAQEFADAFRALLDDPAKANAMGAQGKEYVGAHRTYAVIGPAVAAQYRRLMGQESGLDPASVEAHDN